MDLDNPKRKKSQTNPKPKLAQKKFPIRCESSFTCYKIATYRQFCEKANTKIMYGKQESYLRIVT